MSSSIIRTHKYPLRTYNYFPAGFQQKNVKFYGDVTLVQRFIGIDIVDELYRSSEEKLHKITFP